MPDIDYDCTKTAESFEPVIPMRKSNFDRLMKEKFEMGRKEAMQDEIMFLKENRDTIDGVDVLEVDKRIKKLQGELGK